jgi:hypothetical protein
VQYAVDLAQPGDEIRIAEGTYTDVQLRGGITQVVYISKTVAVRGGFTTGDWDTPDPAGNPTTLDAADLGRVMVIAGPVTATVKGLNITNGDASGQGGYAILHGGYGVYDCGGGVYVSEATVTISHCAVYDNAAWPHSDTRSAGGGGGICLQDSSGARLLGNVIQNNVGTRWGHGFGGGLLLKDTPRAVLRGNTITANLATDRGNGGGGGIYVIDADILTLKQNTIGHNRGSVNANSEGGGGVAVHSSEHAEFVDNTIVGNVAGGAWSQGGGLYLRGSDHALFRGNEIVGNVASTHRGWGGGLYADISDGLTLYGNRLVGNLGTTNPTELSWGGGLYLELGGPCTLTNNALIDNLVTASGNAIYAEGASVRMLHNTIAQVSPMRLAADPDDLSGLFFRDSGPGDHSDVAMTNTILSGYGVGISVTEGSTVTVSGVLWHQTPVTISHSAGATLSVRHSYTGDPLFDADGFHISAGSAAVDAGVDAGVLVDIDGDTRPSGIGPDLGADELPMGVVFLPLVLRDTG